MAIIHSSDLGWTAGQDISQEFAAIAKTLQPGDTFVFDHMYVVSGTNISLANNVTLAGGAPGAGIDIKGTNSTNEAFLVLGDNNKLVDINVKHTDAIHGQNLRPSIKAFGDNIEISNSSFEGYPRIFIQAKGDSLSVVDTVFDGAYYQMRWIGEATNFLVENSLFQNSRGDGIKTARNGTGEGTQNATISNSVFINNGRDGIDTTGGFKGSTIDGSFFINNKVSAIDIKTILENPSDVSPDKISNSDITITNTEFTSDQSNTLVFTLLDRGASNGYGDFVDASNVDTLTPNNISVSNSIFENNRLEAGTSAAWLVKDGHGLESVNNQYLGNIYIEPQNNFNDFSAVGTTTGAARTQKPDSYYQDLAGPDWSSMTYANGGTGPTEPDPIVVTPDPEPDPIVVTPDPEPDPIVVTPPTQDTGSTSFPSQLLDVYLAYTDTDTNVTQLGDGTDIDNGFTAGRALTIYATSQDGSPKIGSVKLDLEGVGSRTENAAPYALFGDKKGDFFGGKELDDGTYTVTMTAFEGSNGSGKTLETVNFDFTIGGSLSTPVIMPSVPADPVVVTLPPETDLQRDAAPLSPDSPLINISLVDTGTDKVVSDLQQGIKLSSNDLSGRKLSIFAEAIDSGTAGIGSMKLELDGQYTKVENVTPYTLFGDSKGDFRGGIELSDGTHFATLTAYSGKSGKGSILDKVTVQFDVGDYDSVMVGGTASAVSSYSSKQDTGTASVSGNQMSITLDGSSWKSLDHFKTITDMTVMKVDFKSSTEGEIQGIGFSNGKGDLGSTFFQLDGSQDLGIQAFNDLYETGSGSDTYFIPVGQYFTGEFDQLVLVSDDDAGLGASSTFENISFFEAVA